MGNVGILKITDTILTMATPRLIERIHTFITQGKTHHTCHDDTHGLTIYVLSHPDFTEPEGTEYMLIVTRDNSGMEYIYRLQVVTPENVILIKTYENPYATP